MNTYYYKPRPGRNRVSKKTGRTRVSQHRTNDVSNTQEVRFRDMGERGGVTKTRYKGRKRIKLSRRKRRKIKKFKRSVLKIVNKRQSISVQHEFLSIPLQVFADTPDYFTSTAAGGVQTVWGGTQQWGLCHGAQATPQTSSLSFINKEQSDFRIRNQGVDLVVTSTDADAANEFYVKSAYHKITIQNLSTAKDLVFDLYECVANTNIAEAAYANPVITWNRVQQLWLQTTTSTTAYPWLKGVEPTDCPQFGRWWKVLNKSKVRIPFSSTPANAYQTFKMWQGKFKYTPKRFDSMFAVKGITKYWMMIVDPEQSSTRYAGTEGMFAIYGHRNVHYYPGTGGLHARNPPQWSYLNLGSFAY